LGCGRDVRQWHVPNVRWVRISFGCRAVGIRWFVKRYFVVVENLSGYWKGIVANVGEYCRGGF